jgi:fumarate hydratase class II
LIKSAAARVNGKLSELPAELAAAIEKAAEDVVSGKYDDQFVVDIFQTGSGTSTNMNANEVIGRVAKAHPNDHVNRGQSSNDVIPSAIHIAAALLANEELLPAMEGLQGSLRKKAEEFKSVIKIGRTHLQDAVPMLLGQEFSGYAAQVEQCIGRVRVALEGLDELPLGGTAVGTGLNAIPGFAAAVIAEIRSRTGLPFREATNHFEAQGAKDAISFLSGALKTYAIALTKIANDIRWLGSGPRCGLGELRLPETQPGSSIMPGKVNPVIVESLLMVIARVYGNDTTVLISGQSGSFFELNVMMPVAGFATLESITLLAAATRNFSERCVEGLQATDRGPELVERSPMLATALNPLIGYDEAAKLAKESMRTGKSIRQLARAHGVGEKELNKVLDLGKMTKPGLEGPGGGG